MWPKPSTDRTGDNPNCGLTNATRNSTRAACTLSWKLCSPTLRTARRPANVAITSSATSIACAMRSSTRKAFAPPPEWSRPAARSPSVLASRGRVCTGPPAAPMPSSHFVVACSVAGSKTSGSVAQCAELLSLQKFGVYPRQRQAIVGGWLWAKVCRPARRDWIVVDSGSIGVPGLRSPPLRLRSGQALSLRDNGGVVGLLQKSFRLPFVLACILLSCCDYAPLDCTTLHFFRSINNLGPATCTIQHQTGRYSTSQA